MTAIRPDWPRRHYLSLRATVARAEGEIANNIMGIEGELETHTETELGEYLSSMKFIGMSYGTKGVVGLFESVSSSCWNEIAKSLECYLTYFKIRAAMGFPNFSSIVVNDAALLFCTAISLQSEPVANWLAEMLLTSYRGDGPLVDRRPTKGKRSVRMEHWRDSPLTTLALKLAGGVLPELAVTPEKSELLPDFYDPLLEATDIKSMQAALSIAVNERVLLTSVSHNDPCPFQWSPFDLFPVDLLAILMVKDSAINRFDFGGLESALCDPPLPFPFESDDLTQRVLTRVASKMPIANVSWTSAAS